MHPAFSVLIFTVTSGFGYGLMLFLVLAQLVFGSPFSSERAYFFAFAIALVLMTVGLLSSTFHLANKKNAWRAFNRFRTSWLSREGVFALVFYPVALGYIGALWHSGFVNSPLVYGLGAACILLCLVLNHCTAMIYASLKTIPQWNTRLVPMAFQLFCFFSGSLAFIAALQLSGNAVGRTWFYLALALAAMCVAFKIHYFRFVGQPSKTTINTATSFTEAKVRLFDTGHSSENFLQREFVYDVGPKTKALARKVAIVAGFCLPMVILLGQLSGWAELGWFSMLAVSSAYLGLLLERWLFFVEAKHVVRRYYGEQS